jgi:uncharacterized BrkB/YihY/UPF0761 family membrane protein
VTDGSKGPTEAPPTPAAQDRPGIIGRLQGGVTRVDRRVRALPPVRGLLSVMDTYDAAGGGLTASGLAYGALFAVIPGLLLIVSLLIIVVDSPEARESVIDWLIGQVPPLEGFASEIITGLANGARVGSIIGLIAFVWGASGFYLGLEAAMERVFPGPRSRDAILARVRGILAVGIVVIAVLSMFVASSAISVIWTLFGPAFDVVLPVVSPLAAIAVSTFVALAVYQLVPSDRPGFRSALPAALLAGLAIGLLTSLFGILTPLLVGGFLGLGVLASVFVALVWFNWVFQILLYGAAYARLRRDQREAQGVPR